MMEGMTHGMGYIRLPKWPPASALCSVCGLTLARLLPHDVLMSGKKDVKLYEIRDSGIHGRGLYAAQPIPRDTWIIQYLGEKIDKEESDRRANVLLEKAKQDGSAKVYVFILNDKWDLDGDIETNDARLMNHSCGPNVEAQIWKGKEIWFLALRDIEQGEELTFNYGFDLEHWEDHPCCCGSSRCVGYIVDEESWPSLKRKIAAKKSWAERKKKQAAEQKKAKRSAKAPAKSKKRLPAKA